VGWTGDRSLVIAGPAVYEGSVVGLFSNRKPPTVAYAMAPVLHMTIEDGEGEASIAGRLRTVLERFPAIAGYATRSLRASWS
jgi:hypothetical protein